MQGTWPVQGVLEQRGGQWLLRYGQNELRFVEVDHRSPSRLCGKPRDWLISYRGGKKPPLVVLDRRNATQRAADDKRLASGRGLAPRQASRASVRTVSGGLPTLGKRN